MEGNELRTGNWINILGMPSKVQTIYSKDQEAICAGDYYCHLPVGRYNAEPIPLTEEWLLKFGFKLSGNYDLTTAKHEGFYNIDREEGGDWFLQVTDTRIKYVHQLQNLYFALTGEELVLTPHRTKSGEIN